VCEPTGGTATTGAYSHHTTTTLETFMTLCPIAIAVGCQKCPAFSVCPLKTAIGDQPSKEDKPKTTESKTSSHKK
jgi:hypothetical protein